MIFLGLRGIALIFFLSGVLRADVTADPSPICLHFAFKRFGRDVARHGLAELVGQKPSRPVIASQEALNL